MAIQLRAATSAGSSSQVSSLATTLPTGWAAGDLALMCAGVGNDTAGLAVTGWTELYDTTNTGDSNGFRAAFYSRTLQSGDTAPSITSGGGKMSYAMIALRSDNGSTLVVDTALDAKMDTATATTHTPNALTASSASVCSVIATVARNSATGATASTHTPPTNWTEPSGGDAGSSSGTTAANRQTSCSVDYRLAQSGTITPGAVTLSLTGYATIFHILIAEQVGATRDTTGGGTGAGAATGAKSVVHAKTGAGAAVGAGSGARAANAAITTGGAASAAAAAGAKAVVHDKTGGSATSGAATGAKSVIHAKTGGAASSAAARGVKTVASEPLYNAIVPLYAYPVFPDWGYVVNASPVGRRVLIANPASGPGTGTDSNYTSALTSARAAGWRVLAYVNTDLAFASPRTEAAIKADVDTWLALYPGLVDGVFFDWWGTGVYGTGHNAIQTNVAAYARTVIPGGLVVGNMGTFPEDSASGQTAMAAADVTCIFEGSYSTWQGTWSPPSFLSTYGPDKRYILVYGNTVTRTTTASRSGTVTSLPVNALVEPIVSGQPVWISSGANSQQFTASSDVAAGATTIPVTSQTANATYASGSTVTYDDWLTTAETRSIVATAKARGNGWMFVTPAGLGYNSMPWGTYQSQAWVESQWAAIDGLIDKTGGGAAGAAGSGAKTVSSATTTSKTGGAASAAAGSGAKSVVHDKTGAAAAATAASGGRTTTTATTYTKTGAAATTAAASGPKTVTGATAYAKTGGAATAAAASGGKTISSAGAVAKTGAAASSAAASGAKTVTSATTYTKTGGASASAAAAGPKTLAGGTAYTKTGAAASGSAASGPKTVSGATASVKTGGGAAGAAAVGGRTLGSSTTNVKAGGGVAAGAATGARSFIQVKTGGVAAAGAAAGAKTTNPYKTGAATSSAAASGAKTIAHTKTGGAAAPLAAGGAKTVTSPGSIDKTGGATSAGAASGSRTTIHSKTGGGAAGTAASGSRTSNARIKTGGGAAGTAASGPKVVTTATVITKAGGAVCATVAVATRMWTRDRTGGATGTGTGNGPKTIAGATVIPKAGGAAAHGATVGTVIVSPPHANVARVHATTPTDPGGWRASAPTDPGGWRASAPTETATYRAGTPVPV